MSNSSGLRFDELRLDYAGLPDLIEYEARDGSKLAYRSYPAESDTHVILLHGSGYHSRYLFVLARELSARNAAHVHTPDLRGHGKNPTRRGDIDYIDQLEDDVLDLIVHIESSHPGAKIVLGGHSSGGGLALRAGGSQAAGSLCGLLLLAPFLGHDAPTTRPASGGWAQPKLHRIIPLSILNSLGIVALNRIVAIEFDMPAEYRDGTETLEYSYRLNTGMAPRNFRSELAEVEAPVLVLVGSDDEAFFAAEYGPAIGPHAPQAVVRELAGVSHMGVAVGPASSPIIMDWLQTL